MDLKRALRLEETSGSGKAKPVRLAFVGAGGKTTVLFSLARQLPAPVMVTTTTHFARWQSSLADCHIYLHGIEDIKNLISGSLGEVVLLTGRETEEERLSGLGAELLEGVRELAEQHGWYLLIEADGSRLRPLKAPAGHEPAIPSFVDMVVVVVGLSALGEPLNAVWVHRPQIFSELSGLSLGEFIHKDAMVRVLNHPQGGLKNIPSGARRIVMLNQADTPERQTMARSMVKELLKVYHSVVITTFTSESGIVSTGHEMLRLVPEVIGAYEPLAGVILAAGGSSRFGQPKQMLTWQGVPLVRKVALTALQAGLSPVVVVIGAYGDQVKTAVQDLPVIVVCNPNWSEGQSTSVQWGLKALPERIGGAIFLLADQPCVSVGLLNALMEGHAQTFSPIVAPVIEGRRGNPVLFDCVTFPYLLSLHGDIGGRVLFSHFSPWWVRWEDSRVLLDVDTPDDYQRLLGISID